MLRKTLDASDDIDVLSFAVLGGARALPRVEARLSIVYQGNATWSKQRRQTMANVFLLQS